MPVGNEPDGVLVAMPGWLTIAEPEACRAVESTPDSPAFEPWSEQFRPPDPTEMLNAEGWLGVVADHERDAFTIPDSRMDWRLRRIQLSEHQMKRVPGEPSDACAFGPVVRAAHVDRLSRAADQVAGAQYLFDLLPA